MILWGAWVLFRGFEYSCEEKRIFTFMWNACRGRRTGRRRQGGRKWRKHIEIKEEAVAQDEQLITRSNLEREIFLRFSSSGMWRRDSG